ncbi:MAG: hypothetical protein JKY34_10925 [Kordiimonadaceae bacterium]|nr:hypothetical protein [Kordiimonadaceae bacterium]
MEHLDNIVKAPLDASCLADTLAPYIEEVSASLEQFDCRFSTAPNAPAEALSAGTDEGALDSIVGLTDEKWAKVMTDLNATRKIADRLTRNPIVRSFAEDILGRKLKPFVINKVRINHPTLQKSRYSWHQDAATWPGLGEQYPILENAIVYTLWLCITRSDKGNGLHLLPSATETRDHEFVENQGYFSAKVAEMESTNQIDIHGAPYTAALFAHKVLHRSASGSDKARLSFDLRYFHA